MVAMYTVYLGGVYQSLFVFLLALTRSSAEAATRAALPQRRSDGLPAASRPARAHT